MKTYPLIAVALLVGFACCSQNLTLQTSPLGLPPAAAPAKDPVNYLIRVEWKQPNADPKSLEVLTTEGTFSLDTIQKNSVKINNNDVPVTLKFTGTLRELSDRGPAPIVSRPQRALCDQHLRQRAKRHVLLLADERRPGIHLRRHVRKTSRHPDR